jgi:cytochrome c
MRRLVKLGLLLAAVTLLGACGGAANGDAETDDAPASSSDGLTAFEREHGIGPITQPVELGPLDASLASAGEQIFRMKCMACHRVDERYIGPPLGNVLLRRSPAYTMNMMMNPTEMSQRHPVAKALLAEYLAPMPFQDLSEQDARALVEYLRTVADSTTADGIPGT